MKKLFISKILLASLSVLLLNACSKSNDGGSNSTYGIGNTNSNPVPAPSFAVTYVIRPLTSDITSITFNDENENQKTARDTDFTSSGSKTIFVTANEFTARISITVSNPATHPVAFRLEIQVNGKTEQTTNFNIPSLVPNATASAVYHVQFK